jgi:hypothetical protein
MADYSERHLEAINKTLISIDQTLDSILRAVEQMYDLQEKILDRLPKK